MSDSDQRDPAEPRDQPDAARPAVEPDQDDTEGHSLLNVELHRTIAASRAREVADWGRSEKARRDAQEAKKRRSR
jgi:hypothetical protein